MTPGEDNIFDLAVIGSGPAGSLAAALAAESGLSTVFLESKKHPRTKICGGFLSARSIALLPGDFKISSLHSEAVYQVSVIKKRKPYIYNSKKRLGLVIDRKYFDRLLAEYARSKGARLRENEPLHALNIISAGNGKDTYYLLETGLPAGGSLKARYLVAADGAMGATAQLAGLRKYRKGPSGWGLSHITNTKSKVADTGTLKFYPLPFLGGMGWSFSGPDWTNHGAGGLLGRRLLIKAFHRIFYDEPENMNPSSWPLPFLGPLQQVAEGNLLLIGDAAGLVEPFSGEGLYNSFSSSILAVEAIRAAERKGGNAADFYNLFFSEHFRKNFAACLWGAFLLYARSVLRPSSLPHYMAALMENKLWFNRDVGDLAAQADDPLTDIIKD